MSRALQDQCRLRAAASVYQAALWAPIVSQSHAYHVLQAPSLRPSTGQQHLCAFPAELERTSDLAAFDLSRAAVTPLYTGSLQMPGRTEALLASPVPPGRFPRLLQHPPPVSRALPPLTPP